MYRANPRVNVELRERLPSTHSNSTWQPGNSNRQPGNSTWQPSNSTWQPGNSTWQPSNSNRQPGNSTWQPSNSNRQPGNSTWQPSNSNRQPGNSTWQPSNSNRQPGNSTWQPSNSTWQPSNSLPTHRRSVSPVSPPLCRRSVSPVRLSVTPPVCRRSVSPPAKSSVSPPVRRSVSPPGRRSVSPSVRLSVSPPGRRSVSPPVRRSVSPVSPPLCRRSVSPARRSVSPASLCVTPVRRSVTPPGGPGQMEVNFSPGPSPPPQAETSRDRRHLDRSLDSPRNVSLLLKELDSLRETNNKLQEELVHREKELQRREVEEVLKEEQKEAESWDRCTGVLEEVLAAQKDRDQALMSRLLLANEERDEALLRARQLQHNTEVVGLEDTDQDLEQLLQRVFDADSALEVQRVGAALVQRLKLERQRTNQITAQEMTAVMDERNQSLAKLKCLEQEVIQEREQRESETMQTKTELLRLQRERGGALEDQQRLEAELQVLRANHSSLDLLAAPAPSANDGVSPAAAAAEAPPPSALMVQRLAREKQSVEAELQRVQEAEREASERVRRLERLVEVLRKKVGSGSVRAVS